VKGRLEVGEERIQVIANEITPLAEAAARGRMNGNGQEKADRSGDRVDLYFRESEVSSDELVQLRDTLLEYPGRCAVYLHLLSGANDETIIELPEQVGVSSTPELEASVERLFGARVNFRSLDS
jgi:hypothetical protein